MESSDPFDYQRAIAEAQSESQRRVRQLAAAWPLQCTGHFDSLYNAPGPDTPVYFGGEEGGGGASAVKHPFQIRVANNRIVVAPGTVNQLLPQGYNGDIPLGGGGVVALRCTTNGAQVNLVEYVRMGTAPDAPLETLGAAPPQFYVVLGTVDGSGAVQQIVRANIAARVTIAKQEEKSSIPVGTSPWNNFYTWLVFETNQYFVS